MVHIHKSLLINLALKYGIVSMFCLEQLAHCVKHRRRIIFKEAHAFLLSSFLAPPTPPSTEGYKLPNAIEEERGDGGGGGLLDGAIRRQGH